MKTALLLLLSTGVLIWAQDKPAEKAEPNKPADSVKRLDSVTWDLNTHKLVWVVQTGTQVGGEFIPSSSARYEVSPDEASMQFADEKRGFTAEEAASLHHLLDVLSLYCAESTVWWDQGKSDSLEQKTNTAPAAKPDGKPVRVNEPPAAKPKPRPVVIDGNMIADSRAH
jgi:hypothetical protein